MTVVSKSDRTLAGLETYLRGAGVQATTTDALESLVEATPPATAALVVFPDEFGSAQACRALSMFKKSRPEVLTVVVTSDPHRFVGEIERRPVATLVLPKPAWAWSILQAVRAGVDRPGSPR